MIDDAVARETARLEALLDAMRELRVRNLRDGRPVAPLDARIAAMERALDRLRDAR